MQNLEFYRPIIPIERAGDDNLNELKISVRYDKGGVNYFSGNQERRGIYVYFKPVRRSGGMVSCTLLSTNKKEDGFKIFVKELGRMSQKQMDAVASKIEPLADKFASLWDSENWNAIYSGVMCALE